MILTRGIALLFLAFAFAQWITFDYPDVNPFYPGAIFAPGMIGQLVNYLIVCGLAGIGLALWHLDQIWRR
jgi:hypothetical protein